jgi:methionine-rich copper-binding protein CopC
MFDPKGARNQTAARDVRGNGVVRRRWRGTRGFTALAASLLVVSLATLGPVRPAWSHAAMVKSLPANGSTVTQAPLEVRAWFTEELAVKPSTLRLYAAQNTLLATGGIDPRQRNTA